MKIRKMSYEECREDFFVKLIKHAENKIKYWQRQKCYRCEIDENLAEAGAEVSYCQDALKALKKQIPKKPDLEGDGYDDNGELIYDTWICPCCEEHYEMDYDDYEFCPKCGQAIDWGDTK